ncbi:duplicated homeodomain-like superfamily protein [Actinidia rufa]|uniref:Duplicated homeodomain-like superfamily protein n=1 Tax=Actinidia rufa TaxID=165716 RepID=A0A7J0GVC6_9ERIC|nr:duplicated homeodomain-like superfamily protein [Actinidia rufa]
MAASFLDHKTTADCIEFYYRNHKSDWFVKIKKKPELPGQGKLCSTNNYLVTSGKWWNLEMNASSLDMLGAAIAVNNADDGRQSQQKCKARFVMGETTVYRAPRGGDGIVQRSGNLHSFSKESEREAVATDVLAGICGSLSSEAMSSCIKKFFQTWRELQDWNRQKLGSSTRQPLTPVVAQDVEDGTCSDESCREMDPTHWKDEEKFIFIQAVSSYDMIRPRPGDEEMHASENVNGSGVDNEDACVVKTSSVICSEISGSKIDEDTMLSALNKNLNESDPAETMNVQTDWNAWTKTMGQEELVVRILSVSPKIWLHMTGSQMCKAIKMLFYLPATESGGDEATVEGTSFGEPLYAEEADGQSGSGKLLILMKIQILAFAEHSNLAEDLPLELNPPPESDVISVEQNVPLECFLQKCNNSQTQSSVAELPFLSQEQKTDHSQPPPFSSSDTEKSCRNGDWKLFGKILTYLVSRQNKDIWCYHENEDGVQHPKLSSKTFNLKFKGSVSGDGNSVPPKLDHINYLGLENLPMRSYGYWDGTRIRTVFLVYRTLLSYWQIILLHSATTIPHLTRSSSSRIQLRNEFEAVSNIPQAAKCMVGINVVGRGVILVGACTGVSEPLAANQNALCKSGTVRCADHQCYQGG